MRPSSPARPRLTSDRASIIESSLPLKKILIVDDESAIRRSLQGALEDEGYKAGTAASGDGEAAWLDAAEVSPEDDTALADWFADASAVKVMHDAKGPMLALAARAMGYRIAILDPDADCPAAPVADSQVVAGYGDVDAALLLAAQSDVVTYELEHVSADAVRAIEEVRPVRPGRFALLMTQDRLAERHFLQQLGVPTADCARSGRSTTCEPARRI